MERPEGESNTLDMPGVARCFADVSYSIAAVHVEAVAIEPPKLRKLSACIFRPKGENQMKATAKPSRILCEEFALPIRCSMHKAASDGA
jgi:hypothetical protein